METRVVPIGELCRLLGPYHPRAALAVLMSGDRLSCCDEAVAAFEGETFLGAATIAPFGEQRNPAMEIAARELGDVTEPAEPTLVGLWVVPEHRGRGVGQQLFEAVIRRMVERSLVPVRVDVMSSRIPRLLERLPEDLRDQLRVVDSGWYTDFMLDA